MIHQFVHQAGHEPHGSEGLGIAHPGRPQHPDDADGAPRADATNKMPADIRAAYNPPSASSASRISTLRFGPEMLLAPEVLATLGSAVKDAGGWDIRALPGFDEYLLGYKDVKNYDGSWTEWGNLVGAPVEKP